MVMSLLSIMRTIREFIGAIIARRVSHEAMLQRFITFLVPFEVPYHLLLLDKDATVAVHTMEVFAVVEFLAVRVAAVGGVNESV